MLKRIFMNRKAIEANKRRAVEDWKPVVQVKAGGVVAEGFHLDILGPENHVMARLVYDPLDEAETGAVLTLQTQQTVVLSEGFKDGIVRVLD